MSTAPNGESAVTFVTHTASPGGAELALRRYVQATSLPTRLVTLEPGGVWQGLHHPEVVPVDGLWGLRRALTGADLVVANTMRAAFLTSLVAPRGVRLIYWVRDGLINSAMSPMALALTRHVTARRVTRYIANSQWTAGTVSTALGVPADLIDVVYSMSGTSLMEGVPPQRELRSPIRLLFLGRLSPWKAPHVAIEALAHLREMGVLATLTIAGRAHFGEDAYVSELESRVAAEPAASLVGHVDDITPLLVEHDILIHCSTTPEPFGQVIVQGLAAGMPVVATDAGGPAEILSGAPSLLYVAGHAGGLATAICGVIDHYEALTRWSTRRASVYSDSLAMRMSDRVLQALR